MDPLFENHTKMTKKVLKEFAQETYYALNKKLRVLCLIMFFVEIFMFIFFLLVGASYSIDLLFFLFLAGVFLFLFSKGYVFKLKENRENLESLHGELPHTVKQFYKNNFEISTNNSHITIEYSQITKVLETEKLIIIMIGKTGIILSKKGFTDNSSFGFKVFIENKIDII